MPEKPADQGEDMPPESKTPLDGKPELPRGRESGSDRDPRRRIQLDRERTARMGAEARWPMRTSIVDDMKMTEDLEPD